MLRRLLLVTLVMIAVFGPILNTPRVAAGSTEANIQTYKENYSAYLEHDKVLADAFLAGYNTSEAQALVARAIWYMENGYMIYGHTKYWDTGFIDCSNFVSLVYKDLGYKLTSASKNYDQVGQKVPGVYSRKIAGTSKYEIVGTENLRPGDIFTFWTDNSDGNGTHIGHVAIYMGMINGKPAIIHTVKNRPTAIGILTDFRYWYGEHFSEARRVLDGQSQTSEKAWQAAPPVIPAVYQLPPQKRIVMPAARFLSALNAEPFGDITGHWAEDQIRQLISMQAIDGYPNGTFGADKAISRAEFATVLVKAFHLSYANGRVFSDTSVHWARDFIATAESHGILSGYNEDYFGPDDPITREQMAVMLVNAAELEMNKSGSLADIFHDSALISDWARPAVVTAFKQKIISGYADGCYRAKTGASRAEAVSVIVNALEATA